MAVIQAFLLFFLLGITSKQAAAAAATSNFTRKVFPSDFIFGAGSSAYQYEGAAYTDGKGPSVWDTSIKNNPDKISDRSNGDVAEDFYHRYKEDVKLMKEIGLDSFRFSISWSRILPRGKISGGVNKLGIQFYNNLINYLLANGIKPFVTIMHYDTPQALMDEYQGFLSSKIVDDYVAYADLVFREFGDRVKYWVTFNEPNVMGYYGYATGAHAPFRCSTYVGNCTAGNSGTEPYIVAHNLLLSHAAAVELYRHKYQAKQKGKMGITIATHWIMPINNTLSSQNAASRALDFLFGWFVEPVTFGDYPKTMRSIVGKLNDPDSSNPLQLSYTTDWQTSLTPEKDGKLIGDATALDWLYVYPKGIMDLMLHIKKKYNNPAVMITENGMAELSNSTLPIEEALKDRVRMNYHSRHIAYLSKAIEAGAKVKGYYAWSFLDDFEWDVGFTLRFGLIYVDYKDNLKRYKKRSAVWYQRFLKGY
ncbi:hypothetical protein V2J09_002427 [Rumex salicifolius]